MTRKIEKYIYFIVVGVFMFSVVKNLRQSRIARQRIEDTEEILTEIEATNREIEDTLKSVETEDYAQEQVRDKLGLVKPGERVIVMPDKEIVKALSFRRKEVKLEEFVEPNWKKWIDLFF